MTAGRAVGRAVGGGLLDDALAFAIVEICGGGGGAVLGVLPGGEASLGIVGQLLTGERTAAAQAGGATTRRTAGLVAAGTVVGGEGGGAAAGLGGGVQVVGVAVGVAAQRAAGETVEGIVGEGLGVAGPAEAVGGGPGAGFEERLH